jgi:alkylation response protein AidB-like acyl-CoA dehydrogenase
MDLFRAVGIDSRLPSQARSARGSEPLTQRKLLDMLAKVETARVYARAVMLYSQANPMGLGYYSNASKVYATQVAFEIASEGVQPYGGMASARGRRSRSYSGTRAPV